MERPLRHRLIIALPLLLALSPALAQAEDPPDWLEPKSHADSLRDMSDPFESFLVGDDETMDTYNEEPERILTPLEKVRPAKLELVGILNDHKDMSGKIAMVRDPEGKSHILRPGVKIGRKNGYVKEIRPEKIIIEEEVVDVSGNKQKKEVTLKLEEGGDDEE